MNPKSFTYTHCDLTYTFTLEHNKSDTIHDNNNISLCDTDKLIIDVVRNEDYATWQTKITIELPDPENINKSINSMYINYPPHIKYQIILDYTLHNLDDMYHVIFPTTCDEHSSIVIEIVVTPKYGDKTSSIITINPVQMPVTDKIKKSLVNYKEYTNNKINSLNERINALEQREITNENTINDLISRLIRLESLPS